jgi:hypothetical protein
MFRAVLFGTRTNDPLKHRMIAQKNLIYFTWSDLM